MRRKEEAKWTTKRDNLVIERDWARKQADQQWEDAKKYEAQGRIEMALDAKTMCEHHSLQVKNINKEIIKIGNMIKELLLKYPTSGLQREKTMR